MKWLVTGWPHCWFTTSGASQVNSKTGPHTWRDRRQGKQLQIGRWQFNKRGNLHRRLLLHDCKMSRSLHPFARTLRVYIEALTGFSHIYCLDGLKNTSLSQGCVPEAASSTGKAGGMHIPHTGRG